MRRFCTAALGLALATVLSVPGTAAAGPLPRAQLRGFDCTHALDPPDRAVSVKAVMRPLAGTERMQVKFDLLVTPDGSTTSSPARGGDLGTWISPKDPTLGQLPGDVWNLTKSVVDLGVPDTYRFRVQFRWIGAGRRVIGSVLRSSRRCHLLELRPDLLVQSPLEVSPITDQPNQDLYTAVIDNAGATGAGPFLVQFVPPDGSTAKTNDVQRLPAFSSVTETFTGPPCAAGDTFTITADSSSEVDDLNRANNSLTALCPVSGTTEATSAGRAAGRPVKATGGVRTSLYLMKR